MRDRAIFGNLVGWDGWQICSGGNKIISVGGGEILPSRAIKMFPLLSDLFCKALGHGHLAPKICRGWGGGAFLYPLLLKTPLIREDENTEKKCREDATNILSV